MDDLEKYTVNIRLFFDSFYGMIIFSVILIFIKSYMVIRVRQKVLKTWPNLQFGQKYCAQRIGREDWVEEAKKWTFGQVKDKITCLLEG